MAVERRSPAPVLDLSRPSGPIDVELEVSEAAEVLMSLCALGDGEDWDTYDLGADWLQARAESLPAELREAADRLMLGSMKVAAHLLGIVWETPRPRTFDAFMEQLAATDPTDLKLHLFGAVSYTHLTLPTICSV